MLSNKANVVLYIILAIFTNTVMADGHIGKWKDILDPTWQADIVNPTLGDQIPNGNFDNSLPPDPVTNPQTITDNRATIPNPVAQEFVASDRTDTLSAAVESGEAAIGKWKDIPNPDFGKEILDPNWESEIADPGWQANIVNPTLGQQIVNPNFDPSKAADPVTNPQMIVDNRTTIPNPVAQLSVPNPTPQELVLEFPGAPEFISSNRAPVKSAIEDHDDLIQGNTNSLNTAISDAIAADVALGGRLDGLGDEIDEEILRIDKNRDDIDQEISDRTDADDALGIRVDGETSARIAGDVALDGRIDTETTERIAGDVALGGRIDTETTERIAGDVALGGRIDTETTERIAADEGLGAEIDREIIRIDNNEERLNVGEERLNAGEAILVNHEGRLNIGEDILVNHEDRITTNEGNIAANHTRIRNLGRELRSGIASVTALGMIPDPAPGHRFSIGAGYGNFEGENAAAFGFTGRVTDSLSIKAGAGFNNETHVVGAGVGYSW